MTLTQFQRGDGLQCNQVCYQSSLDPGKSLNLFPTETHIISERYAAFRTKMKLDRKMKVDKEVWSATLSFQANYLYPSEKQVQKLLSKPCSIREGDQAWKNCMVELGYISGSEQNETGLLEK